MNVRDIYRLLRGVICTYKPPGSTYRYVLSKLKDNICRDLNNLETILPEKCIAVDSSNKECIAVDSSNKECIAVDSSNKECIAVDFSNKECIAVDSSNKEVTNVTPSYADNVLCSGPSYQTNCIRTEIVTPLSKLSSGIFLVCINCGAPLANTLKRLSFTKCYQLKGVLGQATDNFCFTGKVIAQAKYNNVCKSRFENILASYQSVLHTRIFEEYGVPLHSQEAYNFAIKGLYRPVWKGPTIIYSLKIAEFEPPNFTIEVQCINETEVYLKNLLHNLGVSLKCYATCTGIRCIRNGCFHVEHSLAKNQWSLDYIVDNIKLTWEILEKNYPNKLKFSTVVTTDKTFKRAKEKI